MPQKLNHHGASFLGAFGRWGLPNPSETTGKPPRGPWWPVWVCLLAALAGASSAVLDGLAVVP